MKYPRLPVTVSTALLLAIFLVGCQKNTNELPSYYITGPFQKDAVYNASPYIRAHFNENVPAGRGQISTYFENLSGRDLTGIKVLIEVCSGLPAYDSCQYLSGVVAVGSLAAGARTQYQTFYTTGSFNLNPDYVNVYLLDFSGGSATHPFNGYYTGKGTRNDGQPDSVSNVRGVIAADGNFVLRYDIQPANFTGRFTDTFLTDGAIKKSDNTPQYNVVYGDTVQNYSHFDTSITGHLNFNTLFTPAGSPAIVDKGIKFRLIKLN